MKCLICGKNYIALGVHIRLKHKIDPADYKEEFGMMKTTPLCDADLSEHMRKNLKQRLLDPDYLAESIARCKENRFNRVDKPPIIQSQASKNKLIERNKKRFADRLDKLIPIVVEILKTKKTVIDVCRDIGMGQHTVKKIINSGKAEYSVEEARRIGHERRALTMANKNKSS